MNIAITLIDEKRNCNITRGPGYLAAAAERAGHRVAFFDSYFEPLEGIANAIAQGRFDLLMVSSMSMVFPEVVGLARMVKQARPEIPIIYGGIHATLEEGLILEQCPDIDFLCVGEAMNMIGPFLANLGTDKVYHAPNLVYRRDGRIVANPCAAPDDLADLPPFPWHLYRREKVVHHDGFLFVSTSRGCPYNCSYCCNGKMLKLYGKPFIRYRPVDQVIDELVYLKRVYHPDLFFFFDELVLGDVEQCAVLFQRIRRKVAVPFGFMARAESITREVADMLADTGGQYVSICIECGNEPFRRHWLNRQVSNEEIHQAFAWLKERGIYRPALNIIGFPFENDAMLTVDTERLNDQVQPDLTFWSIFYPFPRTKMHQRCLDLDLIDPDKVKQVWSVREESILRGVNLAERRIQLLAKYNRSPFRVRPLEQNEAVCL